VKVAAPAKGETMRTSRLWIVLVLALFAGAIIPSSALASDSWPQFQYGPTHSGFNPREETLNNGNVGGLAVQWEQSLGLEQPVYGTPVVSGGRVFAAGYYGALFAFRARDGQVLWTADLGLPMNVNTPLVFGGLVIVAGGQWDKGGIVAAYDVSTGQRRWTRLLPDDVFLSSPVLYRGYGGRLYLGAAGTLYSLSPSSGRILWSRFLHGDSETGITGPVAVSARGRYVIAATGDGYLYGVSGSSGKVAWSRKLGGGVWRGGAAISKGIGYVANGDQSAEGGGFRLWAFQASSGRVLWSQECGDDVHVTPTVGNGLAYIGAINGTMHAIDARSGAVRWVVDVGGEVWSSAALANGVLYAGTESAVVALDADTGEELYRAVVGSGYANMSSPAVTGGHLYSGSGEGNVFVFGLPD